MFTNGINSIFTTKDKYFENSISSFYAISSLLVCKRQCENDGLRLECMNEKALEHHFGSMNFEVYIFARNLETK